MTDWPTVSPGELTSEMDELERQRFEDEAAYWGEPPPPPVEVNGHAPAVDASERPPWTDEDLDPAIALKVAKLEGRLLSVDELAKLPPPEPLIDGVLFRSSLALLWGKPGAGKSFCALDWALSVATGSWWFQREVEQGLVLYVAAEGSRGVRQRISAWMHDRMVYAVPAEQLQVLPHAVNLLDKEWARALVELSAKLRPTLVVADTLARSMSGGDENAPRDMGMVIDVADRVQRSSGAAVLLVHHTPKDGGSARGHSSLEGAADTSIEVKAEGSSMTIQCPKQKDAEPFEPIRLQRTKVLDSCVLVVSGARETIAELDANRRLALETFRETFGRTGASKSELRDAIESTSSMSRATAYRAMNDLVRDNFLTNTGTEKRPFYVISPGVGSSHVSPRLTESHSEGQSSRLTPPSLGGETEVTGGPETEGGEGTAPGG